MAINQQEKTEEVKEDIVDNVPKASSEDNDASFSLILGLLFALAIFVSIPLLLIRLNILNAGEIVRPYISNESFLNFVLPPIIDPNDVNMMNREKLLALAIENKTKIEELEQRIRELEQVSNTYTKDPNGFEKFVQDKQNLLKQQGQLNSDLQQFENDKNDFYEQVVKADMAQFKNYYEQMNPEIAKEMYEVILGEEKIQADIKQFVSTFETMESSAATAILEKMANSNINLVVEILGYMEKAKSAKILSIMNPSLASRVSSIMANKTSINK